MGQEEEEGKGLYIYILVRQMGQGSGGGTVFGLENRVGKGGRKDSIWFGKWGRGKGLYLVWQKGEGEEE